MSNLMKLLEEATVNWATPKYATGENADNSCKLSCVVLYNTTPPLHNFSFALPEELNNYLDLVSEAKLFLDVEYGQWGLHLLPILEVVNLTYEEIKDRPKDFKTTDVVIGRFIGDLDLLVIDCEKGSNYGSVLVALPLDNRAEWYKVGNSIDIFFSEYLQKEGKKFWE